MLWNSNVLMYDKETESLWSQVLNLAVTGPIKESAMSRSMVR